MTSIFLETKKVCLFCSLEPLKSREIKNIKNYESQILT